MLRRQRYDECVHLFYIFIYTYMDGKDINTGAMVRANKLHICGLSKFIKIKRKFILKNNKYVCIYFN